MNDMITYKKIGRNETGADKRFWYKWMLNYSFGELLGIGAAAVIGRFLFLEFSNISASSTTLITFIILVIAGAAEGLIIGYVQWKSLSKILLHFKPTLWILITTISTIAGWLLILPPAVMVISFLSKFTLISNNYSILYTALAGMTFGALIGIPQFLILKKFYKNAYAWIVANTIGWMLTFLIIYTAMSLLTNATSFVYNMSLIVISCMISGLVQGIVTGTSLHFLMTIKKQHERKPTDRGFPLDQTSSNEIVSLDMNKKNRSYYTAYLNLVASRAAFH